ncbi:uncharacterized, partial [Tachysurus ichikawai]
PFDAISSYISLAPCSHVFKEASSGKHPLHLKCRSLAPFCIQRVPFLRFSPTFGFSDTSDTAERLPDAALAFWMSGMICTNNNADEVSTSICSSSGCWHRVPMHICAPENHVSTLLTQTQRRDQKQPQLTCASGEKTALNGHVTHKQERIDLFVPNSLGFLRASLRFALIDIQLCFFMVSIII